MGFFVNDKGNTFYTNLFIISALDFAGLALNRNIFELAGDILKLFLTCLVRLNRLLNMP